mmetsp:Transcript_13821/g.16030  ORF Transcript_13821/g.16030 Transcript_13821/m.16030 type:complete len:93 (+) Transcript_13821:18-296(+)
MESSSHPFVYMNGFLTNSSQSSSNEEESEEVEDQNGSSANTVLSHLNLLAEAASQRASLSPSLPTLAGSRRRRNGVLLTHMPLPSFSAIRVE